MLVQEPSHLIISFILLKQNIEGKKQKQVG